MRVAYVCADLGVPVFGTKGCSIHVQEIVRSFLKRGDQVDIFMASLGDAVPPDFAQCGVHVYRPPAADTPAQRESAAQTVAEQIAAALELHGPFDLVYERYSLWSSAGPRYGRENGVPSIVEINAPLIQEQKKHRVLVNEALAFTTAQHAFEQATSLVVVSDEVANSISKTFEVDPTKLHVIPNGVDTQRFSPDIPARIPAQEFTIGFVGSLKPWHGVETLLEAFQLMQPDCPPSRLLIIGEGPMQTQLQTTYCSPGSSIAERVHWIGSIPPSDVPGYLTSMDVAVAPYPALPDFYFSPLKVYEYMSCGITTVASNVGQLKQMITHEVNGYLYDPGSPTALSETLSMLASQPLKCTNAGKLARELAVEDFAWDRVLSRILETLSIHCDGRFGRVNVETCERTSRQWH